ncbi:MAG: DUF167 family protein [Pseudomonadota bacterium]
MTVRGDWLAAGNDGVTLKIRAMPRAARDAVAGLADGEDGPRLAVSVRALPDKGAANAAVEALLAKALGVGKGAVRVVGGRTSRRKTIKVTGDPDALVHTLTHMVEAT